MYNLLTGAPDSPGCPGLPMSPGGPYYMLWQNYHIGLYLIECIVLCLLSLQFLQVLLTLLADQVVPSFQVYH